MKTMTLPTPLGVLVQPIVDTAGEEPTIFAVECLTRGPRGRLHEATPLFEYVRRRGLEREMDRACIAKALLTAALCGDYFISINVHPATIADPHDFVQFLMREAERAGIAASRIILEIGEQAPPSDQHAYMSALSRLRELGVGIAIDDVGYGHSNYKAILDCHPDYLKIDRYFVHHVSDDEPRRVVIRSITELARCFGATVVAEGVEREEDHQALREMGIRLFQGYLFSRPFAITEAAEPLSSRSWAVVASQMSATRPQAHRSMNAV